MTDTIPLITGVDSVCIPAQDFDAMTAFYGETLGLPFVKRYGSRPGAEYQAGNLTLAIMRTEDFGGTFSRNAMPIALQVDDVAVAREPGSTSGAAGDDAEPTFRELATDWFSDRRENPAVHPRTVEHDLWQLTRYLLPHFGELRPSQITPLTVKKYRRQIHEQNSAIRAAAEAGEPLRDDRGLRLRPLGNRSINATLRTLAAILDEAEDGGWVLRNVARGRRTREPVERKKRDVLEADEFLSLLEASAQLDQERHWPATLEKAETVRMLRDEVRMQWKQIAERVGVAPTTAMYLYRCKPSSEPLACGPRRAIIATLGLGGLRVTELCELDRRHVNLATATIHVRDAKTEAGVRAVDIRPLLLDDLAAYRAAVRKVDMQAPEFPTRTGRRRTKDNVRARVTRFWRFCRAWRPRLAGSR